MRAIEKSIKGINNSVFTAEPEQQVVNKVKVTKWLVNRKENID